MKVTKLVLDSQLPFAKQLMRMLTHWDMRRLAQHLSIAAALGAGSAGSIAQNVVTSPIPGGTKFLVASCRDQTRQGAMGPARSQDAIVWVAVSPETTSHIATLPGGEKKVSLSDPSFSRIAPIAVESVRQAGERCGYAYPRKQPIRGVAITHIVLFKDRLPAGGALRPDEVVMTRPEDSAALAMYVSTFDGATYTFISNLDPASQAQQKSSDEAKRRSEAAQVAAKEKDQRQGAFFAKHGVAGFVDARALGAWAAEGKPLTTCRTA